jgi:hypothetical protein
MDTVAIMKEEKQPGIDISFTLSFPKARARTPENRGDFAEVAVALVEDQWVCKTTASNKAELDGLALKFFEALQDAAADSGDKVNDCPAASLDLWRQHCIKHGLIDPAAKADSARALFAKYKLRLIGANWVSCNDCAAWVLP